MSICLAKISNYVYQHAAIQLIEICGNLYLRDWDDLKTLGFMAGVFYCAKLQRPGATSSAADAFRRRA